MPKLILQLSLLFISTHILGQQKLLVNTSLSIEGIWRYDELVYKNVLQIKAYTFLDRQKNSLVKDSMPIFQQDLDTSKHMLSTSIYIKPFFHYDLNLPFCKKGNTKEYYSEAGLLQKQVWLSTDTVFINARKKMYFNIERSVWAFLYDTNDNMLELSIEDFVDKFSKRKRQWDTSLNSFTELSKWRNTYDENFREKQSFYMKNNVEYLYSEYIYGPDNNYTYLTYNSDGKLQSKHLYMVNNNNLIIKSIDTIYPPIKCLDCAMKILSEELFYEDTLLSKKIKKEKIGDKELVTLEKYNERGHPIESCEYFTPEDTIEDCETTEYTYDRDKPTYIISTSNKNIHETYYTYNPQGLLAEEKRLHNGKVYYWMVYTYKYF